jgi:hypothetical protein
MSRSRRLGLVLALGLLIVGIARAQAPAPWAAEMSKLDFMVGVWEGEGSMRLGPGDPVAARVVERVQPKLGGTVLQVEGEGKTGSPGSADEKIVHQALGLITFDPESKTHRMLAFKRDGKRVEVPIIIGEKSIEWGFDDPRAGKIRYRMRVDEKGRWLETGDMSRDEGKTWSPFFQMTLTKKP